MMMNRLAIFASGNGTNAERLALYFRDHPSISVTLILSNNEQAYVLERAKRLHIPTIVFSRTDFYRSGFLLDILSVQGIDFVVLAGFLWLLPGYLLKAYPNRIVNIHPALLPEFGGKGMYGARVHEAVLAAGKSYSGITIHYVNEQYDAGELIFQASCPIEPLDTPATLAARVHQLEYAHYPRVIEQVVLGTPLTSGL